MKNKLLKIILALTLAVVTAVCAIACGEGNWKGNVSLTNPGNVIKNGGFVIETDNYVYFINGEQVYTASNKLGTPVKGALMVAEKSKLKNGEAPVPETVVSKVISSGDYSAGIYLFGENIYYATPSSKKDSNGNVAYNYLEFCSTSLDGNKRTEYLTINGNSTAYRFAESDGTVYLIYYDTDATAIISYNTKTGKSTTVVESPASYNFLDNDAIASTGVALLYTESVKDESTGNTKNYNKVFAYSVGAEKGDEVMNGASDNLDNITYAITFVDGENVFFTATPATDSALVKTYSATVNDIVNKNSSAFVLYKDSALVVASNLFVDGKLYTINSTDGMIVEYSELANGNYGYVKAVAKVSASTLLFKEGNYVYYVNSNTELARVDVTNPDGGNEERVSTGTIVSDWYEVTLAGGYVFWLDSTAEGLSYINYVETDVVAVSEDTNDDGEDDKWYLDGVKNLSVISDEDKVSIVSTKISALSSISSIVYDAEEDKYTDEETIKAAREAYDALDKKLQKELTEEYEVLTNYEGYLQVSKLLKEFVDADDEGLEITDANSATWQDKIDEVDKIIDSYGWSTTGLDSILIKNGLYAKQAIQGKIDALSE